MRNALKVDKYGLHEAFPSSDGRTLCAKLSPVWSRERVVHKTLKLVIATTAYKKRSEY
jgi:hypothetical protein